MKITRKAEKINLNQIVDVAVDVHKDILNFYFEVGGKEYTDECRNRTTVIEKRLLRYHGIVCESGKKSLRIICEPTGGYQNKLLRTARRLGFLTSYVNTESVAKFRMIESNDNGKTDTKDPRVISSLGRLNKTLKYRMLSEEYLLLRKLGIVYDDIEVSITRLRCKLDKVMGELFCDYSFKKDFLYSKSGRALMKKYGCSPYRIVKHGFTKFSANMKKAVPRIRKTTLSRLWSDAQSSVLNEMPTSYVDIIEKRLGQLMQDHQQELKRKEELVEQMKEILARLREKDPQIPPPTPGVISAKNLARLLGETGPLRDFVNSRQLLRYGGLNIRMRQSGKFQGQNKISKKGRRLLRKILNQIALPLVKRDKLYGTFYHHKKEVDKMVGNKAMVVVARHFLRKFYGWYISGEAFDQQRFFTCKTEYLKAA